LAKIRFALERVARSMSCYRVRLKNQQKEIIAKPEENDANNLSPAQEALRKLWEEHVRYEFSTRNTDDTLTTMVDDAYVNHIPVLTGGSGRDELREFYSKRFIPQMPSDTEIRAVSRTIGDKPDRGRDDF
jgi:carboxymethylenebutenolidase